MSVRRNDLGPGAYVYDPTVNRLYEVGYNPASQSTVRLIDASSPIDAPRTTSLTLGNALSRLELVKHAPCVDDVASVLADG